MKRMIGRVTSNKMTGTIAVTVDYFKVHPLYKKRLRRSKKFLVSVKDSLNIGDEVEIRETKPISRNVTFIVTRVVNKAEVLPGVKDVAPEKKPKEGHVTTSK